MFVLTKRRGRPKTLDGRFKVGRKVEISKGVLKGRTGTVQKVVGSGFHQRIWVKLDEPDNRRVHFRMVHRSLKPIGESEESTQKRSVSDG